MTITTKFYPLKHNAVRAARKALGGEAIPGTDFELYQGGPEMAWAWRTTAPATAPDPGAAFDGPVEKVDVTALPPPPPAAARAARKEVAKAGRAAKAPKAPRPERDAKKPAVGKRAAILAEAQAGKVPPAPVFPSASDKRWQPLLQRVCELAAAKNVKELRKVEIPSYSSTPKAIARYRDLAVTALQAQAAKG